MNHENEAESTALTWAAEKGHLNVVNTLIAAGEMKWKKGTIVESEK